MSATNAELDRIRAIAQEHNVGDLALNNDEGIKRSDIINRTKLSMNIFPMDCVNKLHPERNYQFAWCPITDNECFQDMKDEGYLPVVEAEWLAERWDWLEPEVNKIRWNSARHLCHRDQFLMYRPKERFDAEMRARADWNENRIDSRMSSDTEQGLRHGLEVEARVNSREYRATPKTSKTVS